MSPVPRAVAAVRPGRWRAWFRVLVLALALALAVPCGDLPAQAAPSGAVVSGAAGSGEYDPLDSALRASGRGGRQAAVLPAASAQSPPADSLRAPSALPSPAAPALPCGPRFVVLRC